MDTKPAGSDLKKVTIRSLQTMKKKKDPIVSLSIYDAQQARLFDEAGGDLIIVGDSAAMVVHGRKNTLPMKMDTMVDHSLAVRNGTDRLFVVGDMPLGSYEVCDEDGVRNAIRFVKEAGCNAVKVETNMAYISRIKAIANACLVVTHIGLNPNKAEILGGYRTQGKTKGSMIELCDTAKAAEDAGSCMILMESVTEEVAEIVRGKVDIPVIGIAAGRKLDGQLMISYDLLGLYKWPGNAPKHFQQYLIERMGVTVSDAISDAFRWYVGAVKNGSFPSEEHVHHLSPEELEKIKEE